MTIADTATAPTDDEIDRLILDALAETDEELVPWAALRWRLPVGFWRAGESLTRLWLAGRVYLLKVKGRNYIGLGDEQDALIAAKAKADGRVRELQCLWTIDPMSTVVSARTMRAARGRQRSSTPAELARRLDPKFVVTPTIQLLSDLAVSSVTEPDQRDVVTTPPRTGKSQLLAVWTVVWALARNPDLQIVLVSYSDELAQGHRTSARGSR